jgi:CRP-like cAMP-binding protein
MLESDTAGAPAHLRPRGGASKRTTARATPPPTELALALLRDAFGAARPTEQEVRALLQHARVQHHRHGEQVLSRDHRAESFWLVVSGQAALGVAAQGRMVQQTRVASAGDWLDAGSALLGPGALYMEDAMAETPLAVLSIPAAEFQRCAMKRPRLLHGLAVVLAGRVSSLLGARLSLVQQTVEARLAAWLLAQFASASNGDRQVVLRQRKRALASELGTTAETFSRILHHWSEVGLVAVRGYTIQLVNEAALRERAAPRR